MGVGGGQDQLRDGGFQIVDRQIVRGKRNEDEDCKEDDGRCLYEISETVSVLLRTLLHHLLLYSRCFLLKIPLHLLTPLFALRGMLLAVGNSLLRALKIELDVGEFEVFFKLFDGGVLHHGELDALVAEILAIPSQQGQHLFLLGVGVYRSKVADIVEATTVLVVYPDADAESLYHF